MEYVCKWNGDYTFLNWITVLCAIILISIAVAVIINLFNIKNFLSIVLISGIVVAFPSVTSIFSYTFAADGYILSFLLAVVSVKVTGAYKNFKGSLIGGILLSLSMGIYQAYVAVAAATVIMVLIVGIIEDKFKNKKEFFIEIIKYFFMGLIGSAIYYIILKIVLKMRYVSLLSYQGISNFMESGIINIKGYLFNFIETYKDIITFFNLPVIARNNFIVVVLYIGLLCGFILLIIYIIDKKVQLWHKIAVMFLILIFPVALNIVLIASKEVFYHMVMRHAWCYVFMFPLVFINWMSMKYSEDIENKYLNIISSVYFKGLKYVTLIITAVMVINFIVIANIGYWSLEIKNQRVYGLMNRIVYSIENFEGFSYDMPVYFIGTERNEFYIDTKMSDDEIKELTGLERSPLIYSDTRFHEYVENYLGVYFKWTTSKQREEINATDEFKEMRHYPEKDSIKIINGVLIVKLS